MGSLSTVPGFQLSGVFPECDQFIFIDLEILANNNSVFGYQLHLLKCLMNLVAATSLIIRAFKVDL